MKQNVKNTIIIIISLTITAILIGFCTVMAPQNMYQMDQEQAGFQEKWDNIDQLPEEEKLELFDQMQEQMAKQMEAQYGQPVQMPQMTREEKLEALNQIKQMEKMLDSAEDTAIDSDIDPEWDQAEPEENVSTTPQNFTIEDGVLTIVSPLIEKKAVILKGVKLCGTALPYQTSSSCDFDNQCKSVIYIDEPIPASLTINREHNGACIEQTLENLSSYYYPVEYATEFTIDEATFNTLNIPAENHTNVEKTTNSKYSGYSVSSFGSQASYSFTYDKHPAQQDEFSLGSAVVRVTFIPLQKEAAQ